MSPSSATASLIFFCLILLLLSAQHGASSHASYKLGSRQFFSKIRGGKSSGTTEQASTVPPATTCSTITTGLGDNKKLPIVHRQSACSPLHGLPSLAAVDVLSRDASLIQRRFSAQSNVAAAPALPPAPTTTIPVDGSPGYSVVVSYGTLAQQFHVFLDTSIGASLLPCKPCAPDSGGCDPALDTSRSSTFAHVLCGSPDCPANCSRGSECPFQYSFTVGKYAEDVLTLAPSMAVPDFRFVCLGVVQAATIDLSRDRHSLPSRLAAAGAATFSYCLPQSPTSHGFLSLGGGGGNTTVREHNHTAVHAALVSSASPRLSSAYLIDVIGMSINGFDIPIPAGTFGGGNGNGSTILGVGVTYSRLVQEAYVPLRDAYREAMAEYNCSVSGFAGFDTCFDFTGVHALALSGVVFKFSNGESLLIDGDKMLYYDDPAAAPFTRACLAFSPFDDGIGHVVAAVIGTYQLASVEVVYDVAGGKVGFIPRRC